MRIATPTAAAAACARLPNPAAAAGSGTRTSAALCRARPSYEHASRRRTYDGRPRSRSQQKQIASVSQLHLFVRIPPGRIPGSLRPRPGEEKRERSLSLTAFALYWLTPGPAPYRQGSRTYVRSYCTCTWVHFSQIKTDRWRGRSSKSDRSACS